MQKMDANMDAKFEENVGTIISAKHGTNCGTTKVDVMIYEKIRKLRCKKGSKGGCKCGCNSGCKSWCNKSRCKSR